MLSEEALVKRITKGLYRNDSVLLGAGEDDAGCIALGKTALVLSTDIMFAGTHFPRRMRPESMGHKAVIANLSDIAAMGGQPIAFLASLGVPPSMRVGYAQRIVCGMNGACREYETPFVGGDTKKAKELTICGHSAGIADAKRLLKRSAAKLGDVLAVTGSLGSAACGLRIMLGAQCDKRIAAPLVAAFSSPKARIAEAHAIAAACPGTACIDISDGVFRALRIIAQASGVGAEINEYAIPMAAQARWFAARHRIALRELLDTGEDYELLLSIRQREFRRASEAVRRAGGRLYAIGVATKRKGVRFDTGEPITMHGYDAFAVRA